MIRVFLVKSQVLHLKVCGPTNIRIVKECVTVQQRKGPGDFSAGPFQLFCLLFGYILHQEGSTAESPACELLIALAIVFTVALVVTNMVFFSKIS